ncbi:unnamed protein product [Sphagnum troendelagicum]|uniref:Uncharacterized protein n=1 Tax=Sphagnum troendelagicum TaxID=128251 RepID=A0ABP0TLZ6_9BRYO
MMALKDNATAPKTPAPPSASRQMGRCFVSSAKSAFRFCGKSSGDAAACGAGRGGLGMPSMATGRSAPSCSAKSFMESRRPSSSFMFRLPGEMACAQSLLPFHNATASACMVSQLGTSACILIQDSLVTSRALNFTVENGFRVYIRTSLLMNLDY